MVLVWNCTKFQVFIYVQFYISLFSLNCVQRIKLLPRIYFYTEIPRKQTKLSASGPRDHCGGLSAIKDLAAETSGESAKSLVTHEHSLTTREDLTGRDLQLMGYHYHLPQKVFRPRVSRLATPS